MKIRISVKGCVLALAVLAAGYMPSCSMKSGKAEPVSVEADSISVQDSLNACDETRGSTEGCYTDAYISDRIMQIYGMSENERGDSAMTEEFFDVYRRVLTADSIMGTQQEVGLLDYNIWLQAQDGENPQISVISTDIAPIEDGTAKVEVEINDNFDKRQLVFLLKWENENWYIDDMLEMYDEKPVSLKKRMTDYLDGIKENESMVNMNNEQQLTTNN